MQYEEPHDDSRAELADRCEYLAKELEKYRANHLRWQTLQNLLRKYKNEARIEMYMNNQHQIVVQRVERPSVYSNWPHWCDNLDDSFDGYVKEQECR